MRLLRRLAAAAVPLALLAAAGQPASSAEDAGWAPAESALITPGVQMITKGAQCTGNFVFRDRAGTVYVGYAAHCAGLGEATDTNGCLVGSHPVGTRVRFEVGAGAATSGTLVGRGRLAYSSWITMRERGMRSGPACAYNDFALVKVRPRDLDKVNPTVPTFGGPEGMASAPVAGDEVYSYGSSSLRGGVALTSPKYGFVTSTDDSGWSHTVLTVTPGIPGDSGSGVLDAEGRALGTVSTVAIAPVPGENGLGDLRRQVRFARKHGGITGLRLVRGTEPFAAPLASG